jgi:hypothetical protein
MAKQEHAYVAKERHTSREVAISFVNGNLSWVRDVVNSRRNPARFALAVRAHLEAIHNEAESFDRLMGAK